MRNVGIDKTNGRFGNVSVQRCGGCGQLWLRYFVEYEGFSGSARWAEVPVDDATAGAILPNKAAAYIDAAPWHIRGGSYWGGALSRGSGPLRWDL